MAALIFDSGALIALERGDRRVAAMLVAAVADGGEAVTSSACVAEVWRDPARQARLARALAGFREHGLDPARARACGLLLAQASLSDVADAAIGALARDGDTVLTSDPRDIGRLLRAPRHARQRPCGLTGEPYASSASSVAFSSSTDW